MHDNVSMMEQTHWSHSISGGRLFEANPHNLYLIHTLVGELKPDKLTAWKRRNDFTHACVDGFNSFLTSSSLATISINMSLELQTSDFQKRHAPNFFMITGTKGTILADHHTFKHYNQIFHPRRRIKLPNLSLTKKEPRPGDSSGHSYFIERYLLSLSEPQNYSPPSSLDEILFSQKMNLEMGSAVEDIINSNTLTFR